MRLPVLIAAAAALLASAAMAQPAATPPRNIDVPAAPVLAGDANQPATDLSGLNLRIEADEVTMTRLRNAELAQENARIAAIRPALPFQGPTYLPPMFWSRGRS